MHYVYMIKDKLNRLYVGVTTDVSKRLHTHNNKNGATFTKSGGFRVVFLEDYGNLKDARSREVQIKKWRREKKDMLIERYSRGLLTKHVLRW